MKLPQPCLPTPVPTAGGAGRHRTELPGNVGIIIGSAFLPAGGSSRLARDSYTPLSSPLLPGNTELLFRTLNDGTECRAYSRWQWIWLMRLENIFRLFPGSLREIGSSQLLPEVTPSPVDQLGLRLQGPHVFPSVLVADEVSKGPYLMDHIHRQSFIIHWNPLHHMLDHPCNLVVHHQLRPTEGHSHFKHPQPVNQVGACQRR